MVSQLRRARLRAGAGLPSVKSSASFPNMRANRSKPRSGCSRPPARAKARRASGSWKPSRSMCSAPTTGRTPRSWQWLRQQADSGNAKAKELLIRVGGGELNAASALARLPVRRDIDLGLGARQQRLPRIASDSLSAIMMVGAFRLPLTTFGMIEASTTRRPSMPWTRAVVIDHRHRIGGDAHLAACRRGDRRSRPCGADRASISASVLTSGPGASSGPRKGSKAFCAKISRVSLMPVRNSWRSCSVCR